jgi:hypothetical protein
VNWACGYATTFNIQVDPQRRRFVRRKSDFALERLVALNAARLQRNESDGLCCGDIPTFVVGLKLNGVAKKQPLTGTVIVRLAPLSRFNFNSAAARRRTKMSKSVWHSASNYLSKLSELSYARSEDRSQATSFSVALRLRTVT